MKKLIAIILTVMLIVSVCPLGAFNFTASAATSGKTGDCTWSLDGTTLTISGNGAMANYSSSSPLPCGTNITKVIIENGVTSIGSCAFYNRSALTSITIPDSVTSIGTEAFWFCSSLTDVYITDIAAWCNIKFGYYYANPMCYAENLYLNGKLVTKVEIPDSVTSIGDYAFYKCSSLTSITIPDSVTSIGNSAFSNCSALSSITIPDSVTSIGNYAFNSCSSLTSITIPENVTSIDNNAFYNCTSLTSITIPDSVTSIGNSAFSNCSALSSITIPDSVTSIGNYAFNSCSSLTSITIPENVTSIDNNAFYNCNSLISITIPDSVTSIDDYVFYGCSSLTSITIPDSVTSIGTEAFEDCSSLTSITIPDSVTSIGSYAFSGCSSLKNVYYTGSYTQRQKIHIDSGNSYLTNATWHYNYCMVATTHTFDDSGFICSSCGYVRYIEYTVSDGAVTITDCDVSVSGNLIIPSTLEGYPVISILYSAFSGCGSLTSITIGKSVTSIGNYAFYNCGSLTSITIPDSVTSIGSYAFYYCSSLTSITIGKSVKSIGEKAFSGCSSLTNVYITDIAAWCNIKFADNYANPMYYADNLYLNNQLVTEITVPQTQIIDERKYYNISSLKNVFLPKELVLVKQNAFYGCSALENVYFEGTADEWAAVTILAGNNYLKNAEVFYNCTKIPGGITGIEITKLPEKLQYIEKKEMLDLRGGVLTLIFDGGATKDIDLATLNVTGFDNTKLGKQTITVKYGVFSAQFEIEIIEQPKTFVAIVSLPDKNHYKFGESLDLTGGKIAVGYPDGTYEIFDITADMVSGYNANDIGDQVLTVKYGSFSDIFIVSVINDGDLNGDGTVNILDLVKMKKALAGIDTTSSLPLDFDGDGDATAKDMIILMGIILAPNKK